MGTELFPASRFMHDRQLNQKLPHSPCVVDLLIETLAPLLDALVVPQLRLPRRVQMAPTSDSTIIMKRLEL